MVTSNEKFLSVYNTQPQTKYTDTQLFSVTDSILKEYYQAFYHHFIGALSVEFSNDETTTINKESLLNSLQRSIDFAKETETKTLNRLKVAQ